MKKLLVLIVSILLTTNILAGQTFGTGASKDKITPISKLLASPKDFENKMVTVSGAIVSVCKKRGCWMKFASDKKYQTLRIKVKDGDMVFPMTLMGKKGYATGKLNAITLPEEKARRYFAHIAEKEGKKFDPSSIKGPQKIYQLVPVGVTIE